MRYAILSVLACCASLLASAALLPLETAPAVRVCPCKRSDPKSCAWGMRVRLRLLLPVAWPALQGVGLLRGVNQRATRLVAVKE